MDQDTRRGRVLIEESREAVIVLDDSDTVVLASRRARQSIEGINEGERVPFATLRGVEAGVKWKRDRSLQASLVGPSSRRRL